MKQRAAFRIDFHAKSAYSMNRIHSIVYAEIIQTKQAKARQETRLSLAEKESARSAYYRATTQKGPKEARFLGAVISSDVLNKARRLTTDAEFERVLLKGRVISTPFFLLKYLGGETSGSRFGFVVSKKVSLRATDRNKAKRRLREAVRAHPVSHAKGYEVVFIARKPILSIGPKETRERVFDALERIRL